MSAPVKRDSRISLSAPKKNTNDIAWQVGDKVSHKKWGVGTVMKVDGENLTINFANPEFGEKKLKAGVAPISKV